MKKLLLILLMVAAIGCKKQSTCYECQVGNQVQDYCGDISQYHPKDAQGNDLQIYCWPK